MDRPTGMYGGRSPRMRALASQDKLTFSSLAASLAVRRTMIGTVGLCAAALPVKEDCEVIS